MRRPGDPPRVRFDLTDDERLIQSGERRHVHHPYSDEPDGGIEVLAYCFEEVFAEKLRALAERERPRDLYDVIHLHRHDADVNREAVLEILKSKCEFKGIAVPTLEWLCASPQHAALRAGLGSDACATSCLNCRRSIPSGMSSRRCLTGCARCR